MVDAHSHLTFLSTSEIKDLVARYPEGRWVLGGYDEEDWLKQIKISKSFLGHFFTSAGLHPWVVQQEGSDVLSNRLLPKLQRIWAQVDLIGEIGVDFSRAKEPFQREQQLRYFILQLEMAPIKPRILHVVRAHDQVLQELRGFQGMGIVHGFQGSLEQAKRYWDLGYLVSVGPSILNPKAQKLRTLIPEIPLDNLLIESDAPSGRGKAQAPDEILLKTMKLVATLKKVSEEELMKNNRRNLIKIGLVL